MPRKFSLQDFNVQSRDLLKAAQDLAASRGHAHVDVPHLLLAWLDDNAVRAAIRDLVDLSELRAKLESLLAESSVVDAEQVFVGKPLLASLQRVAMRHVATDGLVARRDVIVELARSETRGGAVLAAAGLTSSVVARLALSTKPVQERLSEAARLLLRRATEIATERRHPAVTPAHILFAALSGPTGGPTEIALTDVEAHLASIPAELHATTPVLDDDCLSALDVAGEEVVEPAGVIRAIRASDFALNP